MSEIVEHEIIASAGMYSPGQSIIFTAAESFQTSETGSMITFGNLTDRTPVILKASKTARHEWLAYEILPYESVKVPRPIALVEMGSGEAGMLVERIAGRPLKESANREDFLVAGVAMRGLHQVLVSQFGHADMGNSTSDAGVYYEGRMNSVKHVLRRQARPDQIEVVYKSLDGRVSTTQPVFLHHDLTYSNVLVTDHNVCLIDFEWWQGGDPMEDLAIALFHELRNTQTDRWFKAVLEGYQSEEKLPDERRRAIGFHLLLYCLEYINFTEPDHTHLSSKAKRYLALSREHAENYLS